MAKRKSSDQTLKVKKTYKMFVGGAFPRSESGVVYQSKNADCNFCRATRKDLRNAVVAARAAQTSWQSRTAYNRGQIIYRMAEMLDDRRKQFEDELIRQKLSASDAENEVTNTINGLVSYSGWADKWQQIFSCVNSVATGHVNFSTLEPSGVVGLIANENSPLYGFVSLLIPIIVSGNTCIAIASQSNPASAITFAEILNSSDLPSGVVNILTGYESDLVETLAGHMDINSLAIHRELAQPEIAVKHATQNLKRVVWLTETRENPAPSDPYLIEKFCEVKTTWHPVNRATAGKSGY